MMTTQELYLPVNSRISPHQKNATASFKNSKTKFYLQSTQHGQSSFDNSSMNSDINNVFITKSQYTPNNAAAPIISDQYTTSFFANSKNLASTTNRTSTPNKIRLKPMMNQTKTGIQADFSLNKSILNDTATTTQNYLENSHNQKFDNSQSEIKTLKQIKSRLIKVEEILNKYNKEKYEQQEDDGINKYEIVQSRRFQEVQSSQVKLKQRFYLNKTMALRSKSQLRPTILPNTLNATFDQRALQLDSVKVMERMDSSPVRKFSIKKENERLLLHPSRIIRAGTKSPYKVSQRQIKKMTQFERIKQVIEADYSFGVLSLKRKSDIVPPQEQVKIRLDIDKSVSSYNNIVTTGRCEINKEKPDKEMKPLTSHEVIQQELNKLQVVRCVKKQSTTPQKKFIEKLIENQYLNVDDSEFFQKVKENQLKIKNQVQQIQDAKNAYLQLMDLKKA